MVDAVVPDLVLVSLSVELIPLDKLPLDFVFDPVLLLELVSSLVFDLLPVVLEEAELPEAVPEAVEDLVPTEDLGPELLPVALSVSVEDLTAPELLLGS